MMQSKYKRIDPERHKHDTTKPSSYAVDFEYLHRMIFTMAPEIMTRDEDMPSNVQKDVHTYYYHTEARDEKTKKLGSLTSCGQDKYKLSFELSRTVQKVCKPSNL